MLEKIVLISLLVFAIWYTMQPGEIFSFISKWLHPFPDKVKQPIFDCPVCMVPWHGTYLYWLIPWENFGFWPADNRWWEWGVILIAATGLNAVTIRFFRTDEDISLDPEITVDETNKHKPTDGRFHVCPKCNKESFSFYTDCYNPNEDDPNWICLTCGYTKWEQIKETENEGTT